MDKKIRLYTFITSDKRVCRAYSRYYLALFELRHWVNVIKWEYVEV